MDGPVLALDVGERRIGLAVSGPSGVLASSAGVLRRKGLRRDLAALDGVVRQHGATIVVVGLPLSLSGGLGPQAHSVLGFVEQLRASLPVPVETWDERFSSIEAEEVLRAQGTRPRQIRARIDEVAAASILQGYLDGRRVAPPPLVRESSEGVS